MDKSIFDKRLLVIFFQRFHISALLNEGKECYNDCGQQQGPCSYCGGGLCCRLGWSDTSHGCDGTFGDPDDHICTLKPG